MMLKNKDNGRCLSMTGVPKRKQEWNLLDDDDDF